MTNNDIQINSVNLKEKLEATKTLIRSCKSTIFIYITAVSYMVWLGLWCLTPLSTVFQLYRGGQSRTLKKDKQFNVENKKDK
jgi:hypothetical protein